MAVRLQPVNPVSSSPGPGVDALVPSPGAVQIPADMVVFAAGVRPRDDLARECGLEVDARGGVVVDGQCRTSDPAIFAVGECARAAGHIYGLVSPGYQMARVVAETLSGADAAFTGADLSTKLKLLGVEVASFGDAHGETDGAETISWTDIRSLVHKRLVVAPGGRLLGGVLVGDAASYDSLAAMARGEIPTPPAAAGLIAPQFGGAPALAGVGTRPDTATVCSCENVTKGTVVATIAALVGEHGSAGVAGIKGQTRAGTGCGGCVPQLNDLLRDQLTLAGVAVDRGLCEHFAYTRQELFDLVRVGRITTFAALLSSHGSGRGCEVCKPVVASILASIGNRYVLDDEQSGVTGHQRPFFWPTFSATALTRSSPGWPVVRSPRKDSSCSARWHGILASTARSPGASGSISSAPASSSSRPSGVAWSTPASNPGMLTVRQIRTVKSCVGTNWCRYGVGDSTTLAIDLELRYRGLRSPPQDQAGRLRVHPGMCRGGKPRTSGSSPPSGAGISTCAATAARSPAMPSSWPRTSTPPHWCAPSTGS